MAYHYYGLPLIKHHAGVNGDVIYSQQRCKNVVTKNVSLCIDPLVLCLFQCITIFSYREVY